MATTDTAQRVSSVLRFPVLKLIYNSEREITSKRGPSGGLGAIIDASVQFCFVDSQDQSTKIDFELGQDDGTRLLANTRRTLLTEKDAFEELARACGLAIAQFDVKAEFKTAQLTVNLSDLNEKQENDYYEVNATPTGKPSEVKYVITSNHKAGGPMLARHYIEGLDRSPAGRLVLKETLGANPT